MLRELSIHVNIGIKILFLYSLTFNDLYFTHQSKYIVLGIVNSNWVFPLILHQRIDKLNFYVNISVSKV
jgi:hypothetical protein